MSERITQLLPAPIGLKLAYAIADAETQEIQLHEESAACLALVVVGAKQLIVPVEAGDGKLELATDNPNYLGAFWLHDDAVAAFEAFVSEQPE